MNTTHLSKNPESESSAIDKSTVRNFDQTGTLRSRLLKSVLPAVLIPLAVASTIGYYVTLQKAKNEILTKLEANTVLAEEAVSFFIEDSYEIIDLIVANPQIIEAIKTGNEVVKKQNLAQKPIELLEAQFAQTKLVQPNASLNNYLRQAVESSRAAEIHFSQLDGFNIGYSSETSDFVQRDEDWWKIAKSQGRSIDKAEYDASANVTVIAISQAVRDRDTGEFLGVLKAGMSVAELESTLNTYLSSNDTAIETSQVVDLRNGFVIGNVNYAAGQTANMSATERENTEVIGGEAVLEAAKILKSLEADTLNVIEAQQSIAQQSDFSEVQINQLEFDSQTISTALFKYQNKLYALSILSDGEIASIAVVDSQAVTDAGGFLLVTFAITGISLAIVSLGLIVLLAQQLSLPLTNLSSKTQEIAEGNLDVTAVVEGTRETKTLANNFNKLIAQIKNLLEEQTSLAQQQRQEKENLEMAIYTLLDEVSDATDGDLTVRANLDSMELSTVADLFNAIIDNLQDIAIEAKESSSLVGSSLKQNEAEIRQLAEQAIEEAKETRSTLTSIELMSLSIQTVSLNASQVEQIADDTYNTAVDSTSNMNLTVDSIIELQNTVNETGNKMKRLGESSQKIAQALTLIEEIALKTNVLAVNARVEARRAGEYGQGFTIVAEQVGALAEQSVEATKEIANIVSAIQMETREVSQAMESGALQASASTRLVETTKEGLGRVLQKSQEINQLMGSISQATVSQADTSQDVTNLMQKIARLSETTSQSSARVAQSIGETARVAQKLESTVAQFKVAESA